MVSLHSKKRIGLSLCCLLPSSPPDRVDELSEKRQVYDSNKLIASMTQGTYFSPYLHQVPCR